MKPSELLQVALISCAAASVSRGVPLEGAWVIDSGHGNAYERKDCLWDVERCASRVVLQISASERGVRAALMVGVRKGVFETLASEGAAS